MLSLKDLLEALDRWKDWKRMREAPDRIDALEARIAALEERPKGDICPQCNEPGLKPRGHPSVKGVVVTQLMLCPACGSMSTIAKRV